VKLTLRGAVEGMRTILLTLILVLTAVCVGAGTSGRDSRGRKLSVEERREMDRTRVSFVREVEILKVSWAGFFLCTRACSLLLPSSFSFSKIFCFSFYFFMILFWRLFPFISGLYYFYFHDSGLAPASCIPWMY
jgi:hypothetical protein